MRGEVRGAEGASGGGMENGGNGGRGTEIGRDGHLLGRTGRKGKEAAGGVFPAETGAARGGGAENGGYRDGSSSGTMRVLPPGATEKPRTEVRGFS